MLLSEINRHIKREDKVDIFMPAFDRMKIGLWGYGECNVIEMGYNGDLKSQIFAFAFSCSKAETVGRVYLPQYYTPKMYASYFDALFQCAQQSHQESGKLAKMLDGNAPQGQRHLAVERLSDMCYIDGFTSTYVQHTNGSSIVWREDEGDGETFIASPLDDYYLSCVMKMKYSNMAWRVDYPYELDDIVAYMTVCQSMILQRARLLQAV